MPEDVSRTLETLRQALTAGYDALAEGAAAIDPTLTRPVQGVKHQALSGLQDIERKLVQHLKRRQETELGQLAKARTLVLPDNQPQERVFTVAPFLARYGPSLIGELSDHTDHWDRGGFSDRSRVRPQDGRSAGSPHRSQGSVQAG